jgi:hypothetical protein
VFGPNFGVDFTLVNIVLYIVIIVFTLPLRRCCEPLLTTLGSKPLFSGHTFGLGIGRKFEYWFIKPSESTLLSGGCPNLTWILCTLVPLNLYHTQDLNPNINSWSPNLYYEPIWSLDLCFSLISDPIISPPNKFTIVGIMQGTLTCEIYILLLDIMSNKTSVNMHISPTEGGGRTRGVCETINYYHMTHKLLLVDSLIPKSYS